MNKPLVYFFCCLCVIAGCAKKREDNATPINRTPACSFSGNLPPVDLPLYDPPKEPGADEYVLKLRGSGPWWPRMGKIALFIQRAKPHPVSRASESQMIGGDGFVFAPELPSPFSQDAQPGGSMSAWLACEHADGMAPWAIRYRFFGQRDYTLALAWRVTYDHASEPEHEEERTVGDFNGSTCQPPDPSAYELKRNGQERVDLVPIIVYPRLMFGFHDSPEAMCFFKVKDTPDPVVSAPAPSCPSSKCRR